MSIIKAKLVSFKNSILRSAAKFRKTVVTRWRALNPGFRYALMYFVTVVCIASVVWWQFNPGTGFIFVPDSNGNLPPTVQEPHTDDTDQSQIPGQVPNEDNLDQNGFHEENRNVFIPQRGTMAMPLSGEILLGCGEIPFEWSPGNYSGGIDGIHIDGTRGDPILAAWPGVVGKVVHPEQNEPGEVWINHGDWRTVYRNLVSITVSEGQTVNNSQKIGELAAKLLGTYVGDYLEFELWGPDGPHNPLDYVDTSR